MNFFKKLFGKKEKVTAPPPQVTGNENPQDYSDIVDDFPNPFQVGVIYNNREEKKSKNNQHGDN